MLSSFCLEYSIVFPHQLFKINPCLARDRPVFLLEEPLFFGTDQHWPMRMHRQKLLLHRASMAEYSHRLRDAGYQVTLLTCDGKTSGGLETLEKHLPPSGFTLHVVDPIDDVLSRRLNRLVSGRGRLIQKESPNFLSPRSFLEEQFSGNRKPFMARFYEAQRKRLNLLLEKDGSPIGGKWSFDVENRRRLPKNISVPEPHFPRRRSSVIEAAAQIENQFPESVGDLKAFSYPVTHEDAEAWLEDFLNWRFASFGPYEDSISKEYPIVFHSVLTPCLNIGLLQPDQVLERALAYASENEIPLNSLEGFIRQVTGWREFMRAMYETKGVGMRNSNFWNFSRKMPRAFYTGNTGIEPVDHVISQLLSTGYCHHIERLMVLGNFMLLCRIHPTEVYRLFMEMFIDSYDWVMVPNVYGMSQFADGGSFTTKPYLSGSNYIRKMSNFSEGPWCEIWDALFWNFIEDHRSFFSKNPRLALMASTMDKMSPAKRKEHRRTAEQFLKKLELPQ